MQTIPPAPRPRSIGAVTFKPLDAGWQQWIAENRLRHCTPESMLLTMTNAGLDPAECAPAIRRMEQDPAFLAARKMQQLQRKRPLRVPLPPEESLAAMPEAGRSRTKKIVWSHISMGYQPKLTGAWFAAMNQQQAEAKIDQVFTNTLFWIATRTNRCFY